VKVGKVLIFINLAQSALTVNETTATTAVAGLATNAWAVELISGEPNVNFFGDVNLQGKKILDVGRISGYGGAFLIDESGKLTAKEIEAEKATFTKELNVGTPAAPTGITIYDTVTGEPYCLQIAAGALAQKPGKCEQSTVLPTSNDASPASGAEEPAPSPSSETTASNDETTAIDGSLGEEDAEAAATTPTEE